jgi:hypothetical protein
MYWFQDIASAQALARLSSESPHPPCDDGTRQSNPDQLTPLVAAEPLIDQPATDDVAPRWHEDASGTPCPAR